QGGERRSSGACKFHDVLSSFPDSRASLPGSHGLYAAFCGFGLHAATPIRPRPACVDLDVNALRTRRELLKMLPLAATGVLVSDGGRSAVVRAGLAAADRAAALTFRPTHLAPTFPDREVTPLDRFPVNSYLVGDPEIDLDAWRLAVSGRVERAGDY